MKIKSFRGLIPNEGQDTIKLSTNDGSTGYRIVKFQLLGEDLTGRTQESAVKVYSQEQATVDGVVDFNDQTLLAAGFYEQNSSSGIVGGTTVVFDNMKFNQDIYVTHVEGTSTHPVNYYLELEQFKLDIGENTVATLKDIRNTAR